jgi:hypothetical protein
MTWALYTHRRPESRALIVAAFGLYTLLFALGVGSYGGGVLSAIKGGPFELTLNEAKEDLRQTGDKVQAEVITGIRAELNKLNAESQQLRDDLKKQNSASEETLDQLRKLQRRIEPRLLTGTTRERFIRTLKAAGAHAVSGIAYPGLGGSSEPREFAESIRTAILEAGWQAPAKTSQLMASSTSGVMLRVQNTEHLRPQEHALLDALREAGAQPKLQTSTRAPEIWIGANPMLP